MLSHAVLDGSHLYVSAEPDTESSELSGSVSYRIVSVVNTITASHWDEKELLNKAELIDYPVRKCAHMSEYAILTLLGYVTFCSCMAEEDFDSDRRDLPICLHR